MRRGGDKQSCPDVGLYCCFQPGEDVARWLSLPKKKDQDVYASCVIVNRSSNTAWAASAIFLRYRDRESSRCLANTHVVMGKNTIKGRFRPVRARNAFTSVALDGRMAIKKPVNAAIESGLTIAAQRG